RILKMIPPRPMGYDRHRELIGSRTDLTFDALGAAETAAQLTFGAILHTSRAGRLVEHHARDSKQPSLESVLDKLVTSTFKSQAKSGYEGAVQITANEVLLENLLALAKDKRSSTLVKAITFLKLDQLRSWLVTKVAVTDEDWKAHYAYALSQIQQFKDDSGSKEAPNELTPPPGMPIGMFDDGFCSQN
ncbi:MAG: peptidase, partial [Chryseolinea sp.]